jgi:PKD repeat protein
MVAARKGRHERAARGTMEQPFTAGRRQTRMQMHLRAVAIGAALLTTPMAWAQCGALIPASPLLARHTAPVVIERGGQAPFIVPTVVHIFYGGGVQPLGVLQVRPLLDQWNLELRGMNADIADVVPAFAGLVGDLGIELRLATRDDEGNCISGIRYHTYDPAVEQPDIYEDIENTRSYLNIVIVPSNSGSADFPTPLTDPYNVADLIILPSSAAIPEGRVLTHEVGHWCGLYHTFGPYNATGGPCGEDFVADTPPTTGSPGDCTLDRALCDPEVIENVQNHMDYSGCKVMFTQGQVERAVALLTDPTLVRANVTSEANLLATGVTDPAVCAITGALYARPTISCGGVTMSFCAMAERAVPDSVRWTFSGAEPSSATTDQPTAFYATSGSYPVQLIVYGGGSSAVVDTVLTVDVPNNEGNGLPLIDAFPFTVDFEDGFTLPQPNLFVVESSSPTWQLFSGAGHASANSLYVPAEPVGPADTNDLVFGNFDLSGLEQPTVQFKIASTYYATSTWSIIQVRFRDLCSNIFGGDVWFTADLYEFATDQGMNFVPSDDGQWVTLTATHQVWNMATSAEFGLRLIHPTYPSNFTGEAVYIDDLYVGELPIASGITDRMDSAPLRVFPNPTTGSIGVELPGPLPDTARLRLLNSMGQLVLEQRAVVGINRIEVALAPGIYTITLDGRRGARVAVE